MTYLGVELEQAQALANDLRVAAQQSDAIATDVRITQARVDIAVPVAGMLDQIRFDCLASAARIERAVRFIEHYRLVVLPPPWFDGAGSAGSSGASSQMVPFDWSPQPARWQGDRHMPWNEVHQESSHNSYVAAIGIEGLYDSGVRSFELDIHRGAPTDFSPRPGLLWEAAVDHVTHGDDRQGDWWVYHTSFDPDSEIDSLQLGLAALAALPATDPLTIFIDAKDAFTDLYSPALLDELLVDAFGERLYVPADALARSPGAVSLQAAVAEAGWPTVDELESRVIVVVTGEVDGYGGAHPKAFVALSPEFVTDVSGAVLHVPNPSVVFYNEDHRFVSPAEIAAVAATGSLFRSYGHNGCADDDEPLTNYRAMDIDEGVARCAG